MNVGDKIKTTDFCEYSEYPAGTQGIIVMILPECCPFPILVDFEDGKNTPLSIEEVELV